jgi:hypothetical protein
MRPDSPDSIGGQSVEADSDLPITPGNAGKNDLNLLLMFRGRWLRNTAGLIEKIFQPLPVFKELFLILRPAATWDRIISGNPGALVAFLYYYLPMQLVTAMIEGHGLWLLGRQQVAEGMRDRFTPVAICAYELVGGLITLALIFIAALFIRSFANACHARNQFTQSLTTMLLSIGPLFLAQCFNGFPDIYLWLTWLIGISLAMGSLYQGLPRIMKPDPPSAMGLFVGSAAIVFLLMLVGHILIRFWLVKNLDPIVAFLHRAVGAIFDVRAMDD